MSAEQIDVVIKPKTWGFLCTSAHPTGCEANVRDQIRTARTLATDRDGPRRVLIIGASTGYGLAARVTAAFGFGAATVGVFSEKRARGNRTASAGWYNAAAFEKCAAEAGLQSFSLNGDAFANAARERAIDLIRTELDGPIDLVLYSLAAPARRLPDRDETIYTSVKPIGAAFADKTIDTDNDCIVDVHIDPATDDEINDTIKVMGGENWALWLDALAQGNVLAHNAKTVAFSYLGPEITWPIYANGTIGRAKAHLEETATSLRKQHANHGLDARVAMLKSIVTQSSAAIPSIPLYLSLSCRVLKNMGLQETAIEQQNRLFHEFLYPGHADSGADEAAALDEQGRFRLDEHELREDVRQACMDLWRRVDNQNLFELTDYAGYKQEFLRLFGFSRPDIDYAADVAANAPFNCVCV